MDLQAALCQAWVRFEREHGSAEEHLQALLKTTPIVERAAAEVMAAANAEAAAIAQARSLAHGICRIAAGSALCAIQHLRALPLHKAGFQQVCSVVVGKLKRWQPYT